MRRSGSSQDGGGRKGVRRGSERERGRDGWRRKDHSGVCVFVCV